MKRKLRHPIRSITEPYGKAGLLVAILALVLATTGAAFAAAGLNAKQKKEVTAIAKKFAGKPGAPGATGPAGPQGEKGPKGDAGSQGSQGNPGESVTLAAATNCGAPGGTKLSVGTEEAEVCNGKNGAIQPGETLPSEATETGSWGFNVFQAGKVFVPISFAIPVSGGVPYGHALYVKHGQAGIEHATECPGTPEAPAAAKGYLCVYASGEATDISENTSPGNFYSEQAGGGPLLHLMATEEKTPGNLGSYAYGSWAVTAP